MPSSPEELRRPVARPIVTESGNSIPIPQVNKTPLDYTGKTITISGLITFCFPSGFYLQELITKEPNIENVKWSGIKVNKSRNNAPDDFQCNVGQAMKVTGKVITSKMKPAPHSILLFYESLKELEGTHPLPPPVDITHLDIPSISTKPIVIPRKPNMQWEHMTLEEITNGKNAYSTWMSLSGVNVMIKNALCITNGRASKDHVTVLPNHGKGANLSKTGSMIIAKHFDDHDEMGTKAIEIIQNTRQPFKVKSSDVLESVEGILQFFNGTFYIHINQHPQVISSAEEEPIQKFTPNSEALQIVSYNVRRLNADSDNMDTIVDQIAYDMKFPSVIAFQEAEIVNESLLEMTRRLNSQHGKQYTAIEYDEFKSRDLSKKIHGNGFIYDSERVKFNDYQRFYSEQFSQWKKPAIYSFTSIQHERNFYIANIHLAAERGKLELYVDGWIKYGVEKRNEQANELKSYICNSKSTLNGDPLFVMGDFNSTPVESPIKILKESECALDYIPLSEEVEPYTLRVLSTAFHFDHALVFNGNGMTTELIPLRLNTPDSTLDSVSDHDPLMLEFRFGEKSLNHTTIERPILKKKN